MSREAGPLTPGPATRGVTETSKPAGMAATVTAGVAATAAAVAAKLSVLDGMNASSNPDVLGLVGENASAVMEGSCAAGGADAPGVKAPSSSDGRCALTDLARALAAGHKEGRDAHVSISGAIGKPVVRVRACVGGGARCILMYEPNL